MDKEEKEQIEEREQDKELKELIKQQEIPAIIRGGKAQYPFL